MSTTKQDGGPAFPCTREEYDIDNGRWRTVSDDGMSLRDWFAGKALPCIAAFAAQGLHDMADLRYLTVEGKLAADAYRVADAMLKARNA